MLRKNENIFIFLIKSEKTQDREAVYDEYTDWNVKET